MNDSYQDLSSFELPSDFRGRSPLVVQLWWLVQSTLFGCSPQFMFAWRRCLLRVFGATIGHGALIRSTVRVTYPWKVRIGDNSWIGDNVTIYSLSDITIGADVVISQRSYICAATHDYSKTSFDMIGKKVTIEDQVWLATDVFVAPGINIGRGAVIGARSSVFKDVPPGTISVGNPSIVVRSR